MSDVSSLIPPSPEATFRWLTGTMSGPNLTAASEDEVRGTADRTGRIDVREAVQRISEYVGARARDLEFHVDEPTGHTVITVRDRATDTVIRQIPSEEILTVAARIEQMQDGGAFVQGQA